MDLSLHKGSTAGFWNIWGPRKPEAIHAFIAENLDRVDVWGLTEVTSMHQHYDASARVHTSKNPAEPPSRIDGLQLLIQEFSDQLCIEYVTANLQTMQCMVTGNSYDHVGFGSALLIKRELDVVDCGHFLIPFGTKETATRILQWVVYRKGGNVHLVAHFHGVWIKDNTKGDDPRRYYQSGVVRQHLHALEAQYSVDKTVLGGDFNLDIDTIALKLLEEGLGGSDKQYRNLNRLFGNDNTRTPDYRKFDIPGESKHADHVLICDGVIVEEFDYFVGNHVPGSDHAPLLVAWS